MKEITVVTTFHKPGLDLYGQRFLDSFAERVDKRIKLLVYAEDCSPSVDPMCENITVLDAKQALPKLNAFKQKWGNDPKANGIPPEHIKKQRPRDWHKGFKWDAIRFANKVYAVFDACQRSNDWVVWMDADMYVHTPWSYDEFKSLLPDETWITYVGRGKAAATWPECGFYGLNMSNVYCRQFVEQFEHMYEDADNGIFTLPEWHDSFVFGRVLNDIKKHNPNILDYTADTILQTAKTGGGGHPLINTELGKWIDHLKGDRKKLGKSKLSDISVKRNEAYWRS